MRSIFSGTVPLYIQKCQTPRRQKNSQIPQFDASLITLKEDHRNMRKIVIFPILFLTGVILVSINTLYTIPAASAQTTTLQVASIYPQDGATLTNFPASIQVQVTSGGTPVQGAQVQFWFAEYNGGSTVTDLAGYGYLTLLNPNTLDPGYYSWHAIAIKTGFRGGTTGSHFFFIPANGTKISSPPNMQNKTISLGGTICTDQKEYLIGQEMNEGVRISGNVNNYHLGQPIVLEIKSPSGKVAQLVAYGTFLGAFQTVYELGQNSEAGQYTITAYHNYDVFSTIVFDVVKSS